MYSISPPELSQPPEITSSFTKDTSTVLQSTVLAPYTDVNVLYSKYRIVFSIDISPSMMAMDPASGDVLFDRVFVVLTKTLTAMCQPILVPDSNVELFPEIHLTVIAHGSFQKPIVTLAQDVIVKKETLDEVLQDLKQQLAKVEDDAANALMEFQNSNKSYQDAHWYTSEFNVIVHNAVLALDFLPSDAAPAVVVISDCVFNFPEVSKAVATLNNKDVSFTCISVVPKSRDFLYGYIYNSG